METRNFTRHGKHGTLPELLCSTELSGGMNYLICLSVINSFLSITAVMGNILILVALHKESSLHAPSKLLFRTLATTDLCVGIIVQPLVVTAWISLVNKRWNTCRYTNVASHITGYILCSVSLYTLTAISVDRLLAMLLGLRYRQVVTLKRTYVIITVFWVLGVTGAVMHFWNDLITVWYGYIGISLCLVTSIFSYGRIFFALRHQKAQIQNHPHQGQPSQIVPLNIARYSKTVSSALSVQLALVVCYLPQGIVQALTAQREPTLSIFLAGEFTATLVFLNSSLNPILYCWKIREVRQSVKETVRELCCSFC